MSRKGLLFLPLLVVSIWSVSSFGQNATSLSTTFNSCKFNEDKCGVEQVKKWVAGGATVDGEALVSAINNGLTNDVIVYLIQRGTNVNYQGGIERHSPLMELVTGPYRYSPDVLVAVREIVKAGANVNAVDRNGWTALIHIAYLFSDDNAVNTSQILIENGANCAIQDRLKNWTALQYAEYQQVRLLASSNDRSRAFTEERLALLERHGHATLRSRRCHIHPPPIRSFTPC